MFSRQINRNRLAILLVAYVTDRRQATGVFPQTDRNVCGLRQLHRSNNHSCNCPRNDKGDRSNCLEESA